MQDDSEWEGKGPNIETSISSQSRDDQKYSKKAMKYYMTLSTKSVSAVLIDGHILCLVKCLVYQEAGGLVKRSGD